MNLYDATVPVFSKFLVQVDKWIDRTVEHASAKKFDPETMLHWRLAPDQYSFVRQVQSATDQAKWTCAKLAGKQGPSWPDTETTIAELRARIKTATSYLETFTREDFNGAEDRNCQHQWMPAPLRGGDYLDHFAIANFHFHLTTAYSILRHNGVHLGKGDFMGHLPFKTA